MKVLIVLALMALLLSGCGSFWESQGAASEANAQAALRRADAERQNAEAAIIDAQGRGALAESQAKALTTSINANAELTKQAISLADNGEYVVVLGAVALAALALALVVVMTQSRRPTAAQQDAPMVVERGLVIETPFGPVQMLQAQGESRREFVVRVQLLAAVSAAQMLPAPKEGQR
jgi:ABC-type Fe3+-hydroxamate transport system substrate-binding protein